MQLCVTFLCHVSVISDGDRLFSGSGVLVFDSLPLVADSLLVVYLVRMCGVKLLGYPVPAINSVCDLLCFLLYPSSSFRGCSGLLGQGVCGFFSSFVS